MANKKAEGRRQKAENINYEDLTAHEKFPCGPEMTREEMLEWAKHYALASFNEDDPATASIFSHKAETLLIAIGYTFSHEKIVNKWHEQWEAKNNG